jgi:hypothetical protein
MRMLRRSSAGHVAIERVVGMLDGRMGIDIAGGDHFYRFEYTLPEAE